MKEIPDCVGLRARIQNQFELAALPGTTDEDMQQALHFVVVGGGPTGVEFAGTLSDFLRDDLKKKYPELMPYVRVTLLNSAQSILTQFDAGCVGCMERWSGCGVPAAGSSPHAAHSSVPWPCCHWCALQDAAARD